MLTPLLAAGTNEEPQLIQVLQSKCLPAEKDAACARLKHIGTARCVPALAALLGDEQLSHSARYALEPMRLAEAGQALLAALDKTSGLTRVAVINSLGVRGDPAAVPALAKLLADHETSVAAAAARAVGQIGGAEALQALSNAYGPSAGPARVAIADGLLRCANRLLASGRQSKALPIFQNLYAAEKSDALRAAAYRGMVLASGRRGLRLMTRAITGPPGPSQTAALQLVNEVDIPGTSEALAKLLPRVKPPVQLALIEGLAQRGGTVAAPAITRLAPGAAPEVRLAALGALGKLGEATVAPFLAETAAAATGQEQRIAREALTELSRGNVTEVLLIELLAANPGAQMEAARALRERGDQTAVSKLLKMARHGADSTRAAALLALSGLVDEAQLGSLVLLVLHAGSDETLRAEAAEAVAGACRHLQATARLPLQGEALARGMYVGSADARVALLPACAALAAPQARVALRTALQDRNPRVHSAAVRALCDTSDPELLGDILDAARMEPAESSRALAVSAGVRLAREATDYLSVNQRFGALKALLSAAAKPEQKRQVLGGLGAIPLPEALQVVEPLLEESAVQAEAARALIRIASALPASQAQPAAAALKKAVSAAPDGATQQAAEAAVKEVETNADYLTAWQVAGPYRQADKDYAALFDIAFPPEGVEVAQPVQWQHLPPRSDPKQPWVMDLLQTLGGEQCVAYACTWIRSDREQPAQLEIGSDDGLKVWFNGKLVHVRNVTRPLQPCADKIDVSLRAGWNRLLLKITQNTLAWEFCARLVKPDGSHLDSLSCSASPP